jgi:cholesterol oxidase
VSPPVSSVRPAEPQPDRLWFTERASLGLQFTEHMAGFIGAPVADPDDKCACRRAAERAAPGRRKMECTVTIVSDDLEGMLRDRRHLARVVGTITIDDHPPMPVRDGEFRLFEVRADRVETRRMSYRMKGRFPGIQTDYYIEGYKEIRNSFPHRAWPEMTTLYVTISTGDYGRAGTVLSRGVLHLSLGDFLRQLTTIRIRHAQRFVERLDGVACFIGFFAQIVMSTYGRVIAPSTVAVADAPLPQAPRREKKKQWKPQDPIPIITSDGVMIHLTRYIGGFKGPVLLVPGFTTVASSFDTMTVETSLVQYLCGAGYDIWLLDYRASPAFPPAWRAFTIDDIARRDYPAAVRKVYEGTGNRQVQIVAHCVGSISLFMSLLDGQLSRWVKSVVASQVAAHVAVAPFTEAKSGLYLAGLMRLLGVAHLSASFNPRVWGDWIVDQLLKLYPTKERCSNPVCRRLLFIFHEIYRHENLNSETHDAIYQWFGVSSMAALKHLSLMVRAGHVVDGEGQDVYLRYDDPAEHRRQLERLRLPISFMYGLHNHAFLPAATQTIYKELCKIHGPSLYRWKPFKDYGHFDSFIGRDAGKVVFPWILEQLQDPPRP